MKNRLLTVLCVFALLIGAFGIAAAAVDANTVATIDAQGFDNLQDALAAEGQIVLHKDIDETVVIEKDTYIDLNGHNIAAVNVTAGTLYVSDCQTDDFTVADGVYGKIASASGNVVAARDYLMVDEEGLSFHKVDLTLTAMSLRAEKAGLYCKSNFGGDEVVAKYVKTFGVAMSIQGEPTAENLNETCRYSSFAGSKFATGEATSTLLKGIMKEEHAYLFNKVNAETPVYARAYIQLKDGSYVFGTCESRSLRDQTEAIDYGFAELTDSQKNAAVEMFRSFKSVIKNWDVSALPEAYQADEDATIKLLMIGNSHGMDATRLLYEVFKAENPDQKVVIGCMYISGASVGQHDAQAKTGSKSYIFYKIGDYKGAEEDGHWFQSGNESGTEGYKVSLKYGLEEDNWDIVTLQQMNRQAGVADEVYDRLPETDIFYHGYKKTEYTTVVNYIKKYTRPDTLLAWHMVWANPDDPIYLGGEGSDPKLSISESWGIEHTTFFPGEDGKFSTRVMYEKIVANTQNYIVDSTEFLGAKEFDFVLPSATAVQYASDIQGMTQGQVYRDYTHVSDYSKLMVAYVWYAEIMEAMTGEAVAIDEIKVDVIPSHLGSGYLSASSRYPVRDENGDAHITSEMKADILEAVQWTLANPYSLPDAE